jgi:4-amino-4-deoxy-L-arabinose transferase-like glycosyltransferase
VFWIIAQKLQIIERINGVVLFLFFFSLSMFWIKNIPVTPVSDFAEYYDLANRFAIYKFHGLFFVAQSRSPLSTLYYGTVFLLFHSSHFVAMMSSIVLWSFHPVVLRLLALELGLDRRLAALAAIIYTLSPAMICFSSVISTESVFILMIMLAMLYGVRCVKTPTPRLMLLFGLTLGASHLSRPNAFFFAAPLGVVFLWRTLSPPFSAPRLKLLALTALPLSVCLLFQLYLNVTYFHRWSFSSSPYGAYNLLAGTNMKFSGAWNMDDIRLASYDKIKFADPESLDFANNQAVRIATQRIMESPVRFAKFALTEKLFRLWNGDSEAIFWCRGKQLSPDDNGVIKWATKYSDIYLYVFAVLTMLGAALLFFDKHRGTSLLGLGQLLITLVVLIIAGMHLFLEVQPRYHWPLYPFMAIIAAYALSPAHLSWLRRRSG